MGGVSYHVYPFEKDYTVFKAFKKARQTGVFDKEFIEYWMKKLEKLYPKDSKRHAHMRSHIRAGMHTASRCLWSKGYRLFGYTNARGVGSSASEFATFQDEWLRYAYFHRDWSRGLAVAYDVSPSRSFQDFALWHYRKMLECMDGVYWDNTFLSAHYDPLVGGAWTDEKGRVHPGLGLFHLRNLVKRTAIMFWQEGKKLPKRRLPLITLSHITNAMIVPVHSFGNCNMDWEWRYGYEDFQDRFSPDLTVAETIGRQVGAWGTILSGGMYDRKNPRFEWSPRTRLAVCLVNEIQSFDYGPELDYEIYKKLYEFAYGLPDCKVYNYWEKPHPVSVKGLDARTLVISRDGRAIVVVTDYGAGGQGVLRVDLKTLALIPDCKARDIETDEPVQKARADAFTFALKKHDFKILLIE